MPTNDERREVAEILRSGVGTTDYMSDDDFIDWVHGVVSRSRDGHILDRLADFIEPEERTCYIEPLSLHEFFAGEKYILSSDARESAEDERFDRLSRELEEDAHFTCSSCHALFGTREVANADYDILEDGTYEVSGVAPIIKFCPYCGAKVVQQ